MYVVRDRVRRKSLMVGPSTGKPSIVVGHWNQWTYRTNPPRLDLTQDTDLVTYDQYGSCSTCKDSVHPEFVRRVLHRRAYQGRHPRKNQVQYSDKYIDVGDYGGDCSIYSLNDDATVRAAGVYSAFYPQNGSGDMYTGGFLPVWPKSGTGWTLNPLSFLTAAESGTYIGEYGSAASLGTQAWNRYKPKLSSADAGVFFGEIREVLPMLATSAKLFRNVFLRTYLKSDKSVTAMSQTVSDHWLNFQFAWKPFVSDLTNFLEAYLSFNKLLEKAKRENGKWQRRGGSHHPMSSKVTIDYNKTGTGGFDPLYVGGVIRSGTYLLTVKQTETVWFEGRFKYWIPELENNDYAIERVLNFLRIYGFRINPLLLWNLTPWSWLSDWVGNIGDNISNYCSTTSDNLVAKHAYIMKTTDLHLNMQVRIGVCSYPNVIDHYVPAEWNRHAIVKTRRHASPFGFSVDWPSFSARQWSILAALGAMRLPH